MGKLMVSLFLSVHSLAFASSDCRVVEYPDHYEAICGSEAPPARAQPTAVPQGEVAPQVQTFADLPPPPPSPSGAGTEARIERDELGKSFGKVWLKSLPK